MPCGVSKLVRERKSNISIFFPLNFYFDIPKYKLYLLKLESKLELSEDMKKAWLVYCLFVTAILSSCSSSSSGDDLPNNPELHFSVSSISPSNPRVGYSMNIYGSGFGTNMNNVNITFLNQNQGILNAVILNITDNLITLVVPFGAVNGNISIKINNETLLYPLVLTPTVHKPIYFFQNANLRYFHYNSNNKLAISPVNNNGLGLAVAEIYNLEYNSQDDFFYGFTTYSLGSVSSVRYVKFTNSNSQFYLNTICNNYPFNGCGAGLESVTNTLTNKNYAFFEYEGSSTGFRIEEIDSSGNVTIQASFPNLTLESFVVFIPQINSFVYLEDYGGVITIHKINASTYAHTSATLNGSVNNNINAIYKPKPFYSISQNKLYLARPDDIYTIDFVNNTMQGLNTDWYAYTENTNDTPDSAPHNFVYYEPTNDFIIESESFSLQYRLFAVNLATKRTRDIDMANIYGSARVFDWVIKN